MVGELQHYKVSVTGIYNSPTLVMLLLRKVAIGNLSVEWQRNLAGKEYLQIHLPYCDN